MFPQSPTLKSAAVQPKTLDHVAFWVADREPIAAFLERHLGMHVITREDELHADRQRTPAAAS